MANLRRRGRAPRAATGLVLAGGRSARLGRDKALETVGGVPLLRRAADAVAWVCAEVLIAGERSGREGVPLPAGARWVRDIHPGRGPLSGLHAGLATASHEWVLAVGCDMPFLNPLVLELLLSWAPGHEAVVPRVQGRLQPLHAVYARSSLPVAEGLLAASPGSVPPGGRGVPSLQDLVSRLRVRYVQEEEIRSLDPDLASLFGVNTEEDLALARSRVEGPGPPAPH